MIELFHSYTTFFPSHFFLENQGKLVKNMENTESVQIDVEVAAITGHKDLKMLQRYTHLRAEDLARKSQ